MQYDIQDLVSALAHEFPEAQVTLKPEILRGACACYEHVRIEFEGWKTAIIVNQYTKSTYIWPASRRLKKLPKDIELRRKKNTIPEIVKGVALWKARYLKAYPVVEIGPSVRQVLDFAYNGAPLRDKYYR